jgi:hypothetical protein
MLGGDKNFSVTLEEPKSTSVGAPLKKSQLVRRRLPNTRGYDVRQHRREDRGYSLWISAGVEQPISTTRMTRSGAATLFVRTAALPWVALGGHLSAPGW